MSAKNLSVSFTLGKASDPHGANLAHNNRTFIANYIDKNRTGDNVVYVQEDVREAYQKLFGEALAEYNAKQKQPCRRIRDYYSHIANGKREEAFYEVIIQFGDKDNAPCGSQSGKLAQKMLDEYMHEFQKRNPNLYVFNSVLHLDEASPHLHINFVPYTTTPTQNGLATRVSLKEALNQQGFTAAHKKDNRLIKWEAAEREVMEQILKRNGLGRDDKNAHYKHKTVAEYKEHKDAQKLFELKRRQMTPQDRTAQTLRSLQNENLILNSQKARLEKEKLSPWKSFFYSSSDKQLFVQTELDRLQIPYRETENGFEAQACHVQTIRDIEREFKQPKSDSFCTKLRDDVDRLLMQSQSFPDFLERLKREGYEILHGKYLAVKPQLAERAIRLKSLGEDYSEQALQNRLKNKQQFENKINDKIATAPGKDTLEVLVLKTVRHYAITFSCGVLPMKKKNPNKPFTWSNDAELDKLSALNRKLNQGATLTSLRKEFERLEQATAEADSKVAQLKNEVEIFRDLVEKSRQCFEQGNQTAEALQILADHKITMGNYLKVETLLNATLAEYETASKIAENERAKLKTAADLFTLAEEIAGQTYVQKLVSSHQKIMQADMGVPNGIRLV
jgi:hypothetical protein